jgi:hypothetical protein
VPEKHVFGPIPLKVPGRLSRADLEFYRIDHFRPSYVADVFFNDPDVELANADRDRQSYAGSFAIFGHHRCVGDEGHCDAHREIRRFDDRPSNPLTRAFKRVVVTDALRRVAEAEELTITVIATAAPDDEEESAKPLLSFEGLQLATFR